MNAVYRTEERERGEGGERRMNTAPISVAGMVVAPFGGDNDHLLLLLC